MDKGRERKKSYALNFPLAKGCQEMHCPALRKKADEEQIPL